MSDLRTRRRPISKTVETRPQSCRRAASAIQSQRLEKTKMSDFTKNYKTIDVRSQKMVKTKSNVTRIGNRTEQSHQTNKGYMKNLTKKMDVRSQKNLRNFENRCPISEK